MPKKNIEPWYREKRGLWYVTIDGSQINLGPDRDAAFEQFYRLMAGRKKPEPVAGDSVAALVDKFLTWTKKHREERTYEFYQERLQPFILHEIGGVKIGRMPAADVRPFHVEDWLDSRDCSAGHKRGMATSVKRCFNWAVKQGRMAVSPVAALEKPEGARRETIITGAMYEIILSHSAGQNWSDIITVAWETGARPQEILAVEARHYSPGQWFFPKEEAKGKKRPRTVYLTETAEEITRRLCETHPTGKLFRNRKGEEWHRNNLNCRFDRMKKRLGVKLCLYNFRHSFAQRLLEKGVDAMTVSALLGHADLSMLGKVYAHFQNGDYLRSKLTG